MKRLLAPALERSLRKQITGAIGRESWGNVLRRWGKNEHHGVPRVMSFLVVHIFSLGMMFPILIRGGSWAAGVWFSLFWMGSLMIRAAGLQHSLFGRRSELLVEDNLPLTDHEVFDLQWSVHQHWARDRLGGAMFAGLAISGLSFPGLLFGAMVFAILHWLVCGAITPFLVLNFRYSSLRTVGMLLVAGAVTAPFWATSLDLAGMGAGFSSLMTVLPTGWAVHVLLWLSNPTTAGIVATVPIVLVVIWGRSGVNQLRARYQFREADPGAAWSATAEWKFEPQKQKTSAVSANFQEPAQMEADFGLIERTIFKWLTPRERLLLEAFGRFPLGFTRDWWLSWGGLVAFMVFILVVSRSEAAPGGTGVIGMGFLLFYALSPRALTLRAMECPNVARGGEVYLGAFPVDMREMMRMGWKGCVIRMIASIPHLLVLGIFVAGANKGVFGAGETNVEWNLAIVGLGVEQALEFMVLVLIGYPFFFAAECTNMDSRSPDLAVTLMNIVAALVFTGGAVLTAGWVLLWSSALSTAVGMAGFALVMWLGFVYCRRSFHQGGLDLIKAAQTASASRG